MEKGVVNLPSKAENRRETLNKHIRNSQRFYDCYLTVISAVLVFCKYTLNLLDYDADDDDDDDDDYID